MLLHPLPRQPLGLGDLGGGHTLGSNVTVLRRLFISLRRCEAEPHVGQNVILRDTIAVAVHVAEEELGGSIAPLGGFAVPLDRLGVAMRDT